MNRKIVFLLSFCIIWAVSIGYGSPKSPASRQKIDPAVALTKTQGTDQLPKRRPPSAAKGTNTPDTIKPGANRLMTLNFINVDIQEAISALAMQREINIITAPIVSGEISVHLYDVTLDEALNAICLAGGYSFHRRGDLYYVSKPEEGEDPEVEKLQTHVFKLKYVDLDQIEEILGSIPGIRMLKLHKPTRTIVVEDYPANIAKIASVINQLDTMPKQVLIEAKILEIELTDDMTMGVDWDKILNNSRVATSFSRAIIPSDGPTSPQPKTGFGIFGNLIAAAGTSHQFTLAIDALQAKTNVNILSTPRLLAVHGKSARVQVGGQQGYKVTTISNGLAVESIQFIDTGTILDITPHIIDDETILLDVTPSIDAARIEENGIPVVKTTTVKTSLLAKNGQTVFIGGLIQDSKIKQRDIVPFFGDIPVLGVLFGRTSIGIGKSELVVLITTHIVGTELKMIDRQAHEKTQEIHELLEKEPKPARGLAEEIFFPGNEDRGR
jgi:type IV pilus secretin PilQ/predicted competence protein